MKRFYPCLIGLGFFAMGTLLHAQGFPPAPMNWPVPAGGETNATAPNGFYSIANTSGSDTGDETWSVVDMNGDGLADLVVTGTRTASGYIQEFSPNSNSYWKVYLQENTTGILQQDARSSWIAYPNPSRGTMTIDSEQPLRNLEILDLTGRVLQTEQANGERQTIDLSEQPAGVYLLRVRHEGGEGVARIVIE